MRIFGCIICLLFCVPAGVVCGAVITFEGFPDSTFLSTQYPGLTFSNAEILTAGISLDEFEFPPHSGVNVAIDYSGPMSIVFASPVSSVGGYFTYSTRLTLDAYNASSMLVGSDSSPFNNNEALSGDPGSSPNEFLKISFASGISELTITGAPGGGSFALDDLTFTTGKTAVPEPSTLGLATFICLTTLAAWLLRKRGLAINF